MDIPLQLYKEVWKERVCRSLFEAIHRRGAQKTSEEAKGREGGRQQDS